jgi:hypothetical protein
MRLSNKLREHVKRCRPCASSMSDMGMVAMECDAGADLALDNDEDLEEEKETTT